MKVIVNKEACIGCGSCPSICPEVFDINDEGLAYVRTNEKVEDEYKDEAKTALESCPTGAIEEIKEEEN